MEALSKGIKNLGKHIENVNKFGVPAVVAINKFISDTEEEIEFIKKYCKELGAEVSIAEVWEKGGNGGLELADKVLDTIENKESKFNPIYEETLNIKQKIETIAQEIYGAEGVDYSKEAEKQISENRKIRFR